MNKLLIIFCFLSIFHFSKSQNISNETIVTFTDYFIQVVKGMSKNETNQFCVNILKEKKQELVNLFIIAFDSLTKGKLDISAFGPYIFTFYECSDLYALILNLLTIQDYNIKQYGLNMMKKAKFIDKNMQVIMGNNNINSTLFSVGKILSAILGFQFK